MGRGYNGTRGGRSQSSKTSSAAASSTGVNEWEGFAERLYENGDLSIDPDDAVYAKASELSDDAISTNIEYNTDFDVVGVRKSGDSLTLNIIDRYGDSYGPGSSGERSDPVKVYEAGGKSLIDIIIDLRKNANRYRDQLF